MPRTAAQPTRAKSPWRRVTSANPQPTPAGGSVKRTAVAHQRVHGQDAPGPGQALEIATAIDVHQRRRSGQPQGKHGNETLSSREHLSVVTMAAKRLHRVGSARGRDVFEGWRLHAFFARRIRSRTTEGPRGVRVTRTFQGASASSTALAMAAGGEMAPPSPIPLMPRGLRGDGYSRCTVSMAGSSMAVGTR